ncbi:DnaJ family domain-containing protein [Paenibacillus ihbetae]|uniref:Molecular chaperone DnaJ n=1 Tax=Paenibacillus ihbetae TaxID=1870820 RepID=A0ABX3JX27_9BACL|nr:DnaJ family domain-containing protein [Paenibacillus ihbetae]OOC62214.1 molecular chaperone DnaJ [Paenibacillus ihbetae]
MGIFSRLAEQKIEEAVRNGELDNLSMAGKKLPVDDLSHIPEDLRMSYRIMKNAGYVPEEVSLRKECLRLHDLLAAARNDGEQEQLRRKLNEKHLRLQMLLEQRGLGSSGAFMQYESRIRERLLEE